VSIPQVAIRYALALQQAYPTGVDRQTLDKDMETLADILNSLPEVGSFCLKKHVETQQAKILVETAFLPFLGENLKKALFIILNNNRLSILPFLPSAYKKILDADSGVSELELETFQEADLELKDRVAQFFSRILGKKFILKNKINTQLKGGFRVLWNNRLWDYSLIERIRTLRTVLKTNLIRRTP